MKRSTLRLALATAVALAVGAIVAPVTWVAGHTTTIATFDPEQGQLPEGVAVDADGDVFASLTTLGQLVRIPAGSDAPEAFGSVSGFLEGDFGPIGLTVDADGNVYGGVSSQDPEANGVWRFDATTGAAARLAGTEAVAFANDVGFGEDGSLYISDTVGGSVWRVPPGGSAELWVEDPLLQGTGDFGFGFPIGANGIDASSDTVYVAVTERSHIVAIPIAADGSAGTPTTYAQLPEPVDGIALDDAGNIYSAHPTANQVTRLAPDGMVEVIAEVGDGLDGPSSVEIVSGPDGALTAYIANFSIALGTPLGAGPSILAIELDD